MSIRKQSNKINHEKQIDELYESIIDHTWTNSQKELMDQGNEADDYGMELINEEE